MNSNTITILLQEIQVEAENAGQASLAIEGTKDKRIIKSEGDKYHRAMSRLFQYVDDIKLLSRSNGLTKAETVPQINFPETENDET